MALAARWDLNICQFDAVNAFPNSKLDEEVYIELPDRYKLPGKVGRLLRALYGLRRSPLLWQKLLSSALTELGLQAGLEEPCLFLNDNLIVFFFVDDICCMYRACDQAIAMCDGNLRSTIKALIMANEFLEAELTELQAAISSGCAPLASFHSKSSAA